MILKQNPKTWARQLGMFGALSGSISAAACGESNASFSDSERAGQETVSTKTQLQTAAEAACNQDPRVWSGLVSLEVCAGARLFFDETFDGNGRTCGSCHPVANNFTIDQPFMAGLAFDDPLFVNETVPALAGLEAPELRSHGLIKENVDGFEDNDNKFVLRAVPHLFSMSTTIERDPDDGTSADFVERTGWSGDGVAGGALADFADGAITQHFPTDLSREEGESFRLTTATERQQLLAYQLSLGRTNELDLNTIVLTDSFAETGRQQFLDPQVGRCNECHANAGANSPNGKNTNFATGIEGFAPSSINHPIFAGVELQDAGFGGHGEPFPNIAVPGSDVNNGFGDNSFNTPSLIEIADTAPFFHHNGITGSLAGAISFYSADFFNDSPAGQDLIDDFGTPVTLPNGSIINIQQFLKLLNVVFNIDLARQRLDAAELLNTQYWGYRDDIQLGLIGLALAELDDAQTVLTAPDGPPLNSSTHAALAAAIATATSAEEELDPGTRLNITRQALAALDELRDDFGTNIDFELGPGNLMF